MGMHAFRRLREQEAAERKNSTPEPAIFDEPAPQKRTRKSSASVASTAEN